VGSAVGLKTSALNLKDFITHVFPKNIFEAMASNEILQILVFAVFFGLALGHLHNQAARSLVIPWKKWSMSCSRSPTT
jgi:Na+/H+-dicarboxylate symporter